MYRISRVEALSEYRLEPAFSNDTRGTVDVSNLTGTGTFSLWIDYGRFLKAKIGEIITSL